ncbi:MAG: lipid A biosynthesis acyltransferase [Pseudomonadota bacterium]
MKKIRYLIEAALVRALISLFRVLPPETASNLGGRIGRNIGPCLSVSRKATRHITNSLHTDTKQTQTILHGMWDNLGRVFAEYPHLKTITMHRTELLGVENLGNLPTTKGPAIFFASHLANWEVAAPTLRRQNIDVDLIYRAPNNPYVQNVLDTCRSMDGVLRTYPKSASGMRQVMTALKEGRRIGILIDQKYNQGVEADFFGQPAMTSPAFIQLAQKFNCPLIPVQVERLPDAHFRVTVHPAFDITKDKMVLLNAAHQLLEEWISAAPAQWLWLHKRWKN